MDLFANVTEIYILQTLLLRKERLLLSTVSNSMQR